MRRPKSKYQIQGLRMFRLTLHLIGMLVTYVIKNLNNSIINRIISNNNQYVLFLKHYVNDMNIYLYL